MAENPYAPPGAQLEAPRVLMGWRRALAYTTLIGTLLLIALPLSAAFALLVHRWFHGQWLFSPRCARVLFTAFIPAWFLLAYGFSLGWAWFVSGFWPVSEVKEFFRGGTVIRWLTILFEKHLDALLGTTRRP